MGKSALFLWCFFIFSDFYAETFKLATWNILSEEPYTKHATVKKMLWKERKQLLENQLKTLSKEVDIICLQECDLRGKSLFFKDTDVWILKYMNSLDFFFALPKEDAQRTEMKKSYLVSCVFYKNNRFNAENPYSFKVYNNLNVIKNNYNICNSITLTFQNNTKAPSIKIISVHRPTMENASLSNLAADILHNKNTEGFTVICGDFNYASIQTAYPDIKTTTQNYKSLTNKDHFDTKTWNDAFKNNQLPTAYSGSGFLERLDYIFYTHNDPKASQYKLECVHTTQIPDSNLWDTFIKHSRSKELPETIKDFTDFPSDHAILIAEFKIEEEKKIKNGDDKNIEKLAQGLYSIASKN